MKILVSAAGQFDGRIGGGQVYVQKLAAELSRRNHHVVVVSAQTWDGGAKKFEVTWRNWNGIPVAGVSFDPMAIRADERWADRPQPLCAALRQVVDEVQPDIIHLNGLKPALVSVARDRSIPHVVTAHHGGVACPAGALLRPDDSLCQISMDEADCAACYCRQLRGGGRVGGMLATMPSWVHRPLGRALNVLPNPTYVGRVLMYPWLVGRAVEGKRYALTQAQRWIAPSRAIADVLIRNGTPPERVDVVPHGIEPTSRTAIECLSQRPVRFGYIGQINRPKGLRVLFEAFSKLPVSTAELHVVGQPQRPGEQEYFDAAIAPLAGRPDVHLRGATPHAHISAVLSEIDVLVLPTICLEVFGLVVLEAFSAGRPVIVSDCGGPAEIVRNGVDGLVVARNDASALSRAMRDLVDRPDRILQMAGQIRPVRTLAEHVADLEAVYQRVVHEAGGRVLAAAG